MINAIGPRVQTMTLDCGDHVMTFAPGDYIGKKIFRKGHFERDHVDRLLAILKERQLLREGSTLLELGGNIGTQTIYFALSGPLPALSASNRIRETSICCAPISPRTSSAIW